MKISRHYTLTALAAASFALGAALLPSTAVAVPPATQLSNDSFREGGSSASISNHVQATLANFATVDRVYRGCGTGTNAAWGTTNGCAGTAVVGSGSKLLDFWVIQGTLKNSATDPDGLGIPNPPATDVTYRLSANGSGLGVFCASTVATSSNTIGFLAPEGPDGIPNSGDDAGANPNVFGTLGTPSGWPTGGKAALVQCNTGVQSLINNLSGNITNIPVLSADPNAQLCVVNDDANNNGDIDTKEDGFPSGSETTNIAATCSMGFADLPPGDFANTVTVRGQQVNTLTFNQAVSTGAQTFKLVVNKSVRSLQNDANKVWLNDPNVENLFAPAAIGNACTWRSVGAISEATIGNPGSEIANSPITVCFRENGSGTRETYRNTFQRNPAGDKAMGTFDAATDPITNVRSCPQRTEGGSNISINKTFTRNFTTSDESTCVTNNPGAIGYVNASRSVANAYAVPVFGIDPDVENATNNLRTLVKCGKYPYWGPLAGGVGPAAQPSDPFVAAHLTALASEKVFATGADYIPFGTTNTGISFRKSATAGAYTNQFRANNCPATWSQPAVAPN